MNSGNTESGSGTNNVFWDRFSKYLLHIESGFKPIRVSIRITFIYLLFGALWILLSDKVLQVAVSDKDTMTIISMLKGWIYVLITGILIGSMIYSTVNRLWSAEQQILRGYEELTAAHEQLEAAHEELIASEEELREQYNVLMENQVKLNEYQEKLHHMAYYDSLTGLPNRLSLYEAMSHELTAKKICKGALFFIDLDNFKYVNDTLGHAFGDQLLTKIGERFLAVFKDKGTAYRLGGDEFVLCVKGYKELEDVEYIALKIISDFKRPFYIGGSILHTTFSIGVSLYPEHGSSPEELLKCADIAMYKAKGSGRNKYIIFDKKMDEEVKERVVIEKYLRKALENNELVVHYQPQLELKSSRVTGIEALLRWNSPELGIVSPLRFIKVAEECNLINSIGEWVLREACYFIKGLHQQGYRDLTVSVNVSMLQLLQDNFSDIVIQVLDFLNLEAEYLELEVTESILMESYDTINSKLTLLRKRGVKIALDDFGKGYSSLSYLKQLPITTLKIDKNFIDSIISEEDGATLTGQIVSIGKNMGLTVIAEGVEEKEQLDYLCSHGCDKIQGYIFSRLCQRRK
jgi:diguanylate cyclase (GGDEF)-like protein